MGEFFELMEDGILDENGEYTGYFVDVFSRRKRKRHFANAVQCVRGVKSYMRAHFSGMRQMPSVNEWLRRYFVFNGWMKEDELCTQDNQEKHCITLQKNWPHFVKWFRSQKGTSFYREYPVPIEPLK